MGCRGRNLKGKEQMSQISNKSSHSKNLGKEKQNKLKACNKQTNKQKTQNSIKLKTESQGKINETKA
jgi:hypothetical protein